DFVRRGPALLRRAPIEVAVLRTTKAAHFDALADSPLLARLGELRLGHCANSTAQSLARLLASPHAAGLRRLTVPLLGLGPGVGEALAGSRLASLGSLRLDGTYGLDPSLAEALAGAPVLGNLRALWINNARIGLPGVQALAASPHLTRLTALGLRVE